AEDGIRDFHVTGVQTCALPILAVSGCFVVAETVTLVVGTAGVPASPVALDDETPARDEGIHGGAHPAVWHRHLTGVIGEPRVVEIGRASGRGRGCSAGGEA